MMNLPRLPSDATPAQHERFSKLAWLGYRWQGKRGVCESFIVEHPERGWMVSVYRNGRVESMPDASSPIWDEG